MSKEILTRHEVMELFEARGVNVGDWASKNGFKRDDVYAVLHGRTKGRRGQAHRIALALGMKRDRVVKGDGRVLGLPGDEVEKAAERQEEE